MGMVSEFKEFAVKGNAMDLAVGVIIGAAFGKIVSSVVQDLIMPVVSAIFTMPDFASLYVVLGENQANLTSLEELKKAGVPVFAYGSFLTVLIDFIIIAFIIFMLVRQINKLKKEPAPEAPAATPEDIVLLREIRDSLKK